MYKEELEINKKCTDSITRKWFTGKRPITD